MTWDTSCRDWERRLLAGETLVPDLPLFTERSEKALRMFRRLHLPDVMGRPTRGDVCGPYIYPIVSAVFGSYDPVAHEQIIKEFFLMIPKGNDKTGTAATIAVLWCLMNQKPEAELCIVAPSKKIADRSFEYAAGIIRADQDLEKIFYPPKFNNTRVIEMRGLGASISVIAADTSAVTGAKQTVTIIDELHELSDNSQAQAIMTEISGAIGKARDNFMFTITTQSKKPPRGVFRDYLLKARAVRDGQLKIPFLPVLYELPPHLAKDGGWKKREYWPLVNPNLDRSIQSEYLETQLAEKEQMDAAAQALFASQHFNVEIGVGLSTDGWVGAMYWPGAGDPGLTREAIAEKNPTATPQEIPLLQLMEMCRRCDVLTMGIDGGGLDDLLGVAVLGREIGTGNWLLWNRAIAAPIAIERNKAAIPDYDRFKKEGDLIIADLPADMDDLDMLIGIIEMTGKLTTVSVDPACVDDIAEVCADYDITEDNGRFVGERQGIGLMKAIKTAERKLASRKLLHCSQALMTWSAGNARVKLTSAAMLIEREASGKGKIDPLIASYNAIMGMTANPQLAVKADIRAMVG